MAALLKIVKAYLPKYNKPECIHSHDIRVITSSSKNTVFLHSPIETSLPRGTPSPTSSSLSSIGSPSPTGIIQICFSGERAVEVAQPPRVSSYQAELQSASQETFDAKDTAEKALFQLVGMGFLPADAREALSHVGTGCPGCFHCLGLALDHLIASYNSSH